LEDLRDFLKDPLTLVDGADSITVNPTLYTFNEAGALIDQYTIDSALIRTRWATQRRRSEINRPDVVPF